MTKDEALALIAAGEGQAIEYKETTAQMHRAIETLAAFGSQPQGGSLLFGVRDTGQLLPGFSVGVKTPEKIAAAVKQNTLSMVLAEPLYPDIHTFDDPPLIVVEVTATQVARGPFIAFGRRWERVGKSTHQVKMDYKQLVRAYQEALYDEEDEGPMPYRFCPTCASETLERSTAVDHGHDRVYYIITCKQCGWSDWTE